MTPVERGSARSDVTHTQSHHRPIHHARRDGQNCDDAWHKFRGRRQIKTPSTKRAKIEPGGRAVLITADSAPSLEQRLFALSSSINVSGKVINILHDKTTLTLLNIVDVECLEVGLAFNRNIQAC